MKRNNSISRTFPFTRSCSFSKLELKKRFSDIFSYTRQTNECTNDPLEPSYLVKESVKMKKELIFVPEINDYIEVEIEVDRPIIRTKKELLALTKTTQYGCESDMNQYTEELDQIINNYYSQDYLLPELPSIVSSTTSRPNSIISQKSQNDTLNDNNSDTYTLDSYYLDNELSNSSVFYKNIYDKLKNIKKRKFSISSIYSIYTQSDECSLISLSSVASDNSILGKHLLQNSNRHSF